MVGVAADRRDTDIRAMGALAKTVFDRLVLREGHGLRGSASVEAAQLLRQGAFNAGCQPEQITVVQEATLAVATCLQLDVLFADDVEKVCQRIVKFRPGTAVRQAPGHVSESKLEKV